MIRKIKCFEMVCDSCGEGIDAGDGVYHAETKKELIEIYEYSGIELSILKKKKHFCSDKCEFGA